MLFDRSWYNRAGVERVMDFCTDEEYEEFFRTVPEFEKMLARSGIKLIKYWFSITDDEQYMRFLGRLHDPLKQWKLSSMDLESRRRWEAYTKAKEIMLERTHIPEAPWWVVQAVDKKRARLNCIRHSSCPTGKWSTRRSSYRIASAAPTICATRCRCTWSCLRSIDLCAGREKSLLKKAARATPSTSLGIRTVHPSGQP